MSWLWPLLDTRPAGPPVGLPVTGVDRHTGTTGAPFISTEHTIGRTQQSYLRPPGGQYVTRRFLDHLAPGLSDRDLAILHEVARLGLMTGRQLQTVFFITDDANPDSRARAARAVLHRLTKLQLIGRFERRIGGASFGSASYVYGLDLAGHKLLGLKGRPRRMYEPLSPHIEHTLLEAELYARLVTAHRAGQLTLLEHQAEPECWVQTEFGTLEADSYTRVQGPDGRRRRWYVEVDRGGPHGWQSERAIHKKLDRYRLFWERALVKMPVFPRVLFAAPDPRRMAVVQTIIDKQPAVIRPLFAVADFDAAVAVLAGQPHASGLPGIGGCTGWLPRS